MKTLSIILLIVLCSCSSMEEPIAFVQYNGVDMNGVSAKQFDFNLKITVKNNLFLPVKIMPSTIDFVIDQKSFGQVTFDDKIKMKARRNTDIIVPLHLTLEDGAFLNLMTYMNKESAVLKLNGDVHAKMLFISKDVPLNFSKTFSPKTFNPFSNNR